MITICSWQCFEPHSQVNLLPFLSQCFFEEYTLVSVSNNLYLYAKTRRDLTIELLPVNSS
jgi:hypothetical protein